MNENPHQRFVDVKPSPDEPGDGKIQITVVIPSRASGFGRHLGGYWCSRIFWPTGKSTRWVTADELAEMRADPRMLLAITTAGDADELAKTPGAPELAQLRLERAFRVFDPRGH